MRASAALDSRASPFDRFQNGLRHTIERDELSVGAKFGLTSHFASSTLALSTSNGRRPL